MSCAVCTLLGSVAPHRSWAVVVRHGGFRTGATSGSQGRTFWGHQNQRPRRAATDGVISDRTIKVSNSIHVAFPRQNRWSTSTSSYIQKIAAEYFMSSTEREARLIELVAAF